GRLVAYGVSAMAPSTSRRVLTAAWQLARMPRFGFVRLMNENHGVLGFNLRHLWDEMERLREYLLKVLDHYPEGHVRPHIARRLPPAEAARAHAFMQNRETVGKLVLVPWPRGTTTRAERPPPVRQ